MYYSRRAKLSESADDALFKRSESCTIRFHDLLPERRQLVYNSRKKTPWPTTNYALFLDSSCAIAGNLFIRRIRFNDGYWLCYLCFWGPYADAFMSFFSVLNKRNTNGWISAAWCRTISWMTADFRILTHPFVTTSIPQIDLPLKSTRHCQCQCVEFIAH